MTRLNQVFTLTIATTTLCMSLASVASADIIYSNTADGEILRDMTALTTTFNQTNLTARAGKPTGSTSAVRTNAVFVFDLTGVATITSAEFGAYLIANSVDVSLSASLMGVGYGSTAPGWTSTVGYHQSGTPETGIPLIMSGFVTRTSGSRATTGQYWTTTTGTVETNLVTFLNARPVGEDFVYLRVNDHGSATNNAKSWTFATAEAIGTSTDPYLNLTLIPEPASMALLGLGGLLMLGRSRSSRRCSSRNVCRTVVGECECTFLE